MLCVVEVARECRRRCNWAQDAPLTLYEEIQAGNVEKVVDLSATLDQGLDELMDGDIIVFHKNYDINQIGRKLKTMHEFYVYMQYKLVHLSIILSIKTCR